MIKLESWKVFGKLIQYDSLGHQKCSCARNGSKNEVTIYLDDPQSFLTFLNYSVFKKRYWCYKHFIKAILNFHLKSGIKILECSFDLNILHSKWYTRSYPFLIFLQASIFLRNLLYVYSSFFTKSSKMLLFCITVCFCLYVCLSTIFLKIDFLKHWLRRKYTDICRR